MASKHAELVAEIVQVDSLEGRLLITEEGASLMSSTIREHGPHLRVAEEVQSSAEVASHSAKSKP